MCGGASVCVCGRLMPAAPTPPSAFGQDASLRRRVGAFIVAVVANLLLLLMLFTLAPSPTPKPKGDDGLAVVQLSPDLGKAPEKAKKAEKAKPVAARQPVARPQKPVPAPKQVLDTTDQPAAKLNMIIVGKDVLDATDRAMNAPHDAPQQSADSGGAAGGGEGSGGGGDGAVGKAPNGEPLYNAEWYREPTDAELAFYLPKNGPRSGWGMIACRTAPNWRVEDCVEIGQSPQGSGLSSAVRQAAWQFKVRPPRVGDKRVIGAWVRIRIDYTSRTVSQ